MLAFLFPGQGSLRPGMGAGWATTPSWASLDRLSVVLGRDLGALLLEADGPTLQATHNAQAATFALSLVALDHLRRGGLQPAVVAGHSLGEYSALVAAGVLTPDEGMRLVAARGEAMLAAAGAEPGTMAAVLGLEPEAVAAVCASTGERVWLANDNAPGQVVVAGSVAGVAAAEASAKAAGASRVMPLAVGGAFHSPLMAGAQERLDAALRAAHFGPAGVPVVTNADAQAHRDGPWDELLSAQLCQPVRWRQSLAALAGLGATAYVEVGPGQTLTGMVKRTLPASSRYPAGTPAQADTAIAALATTGRP